MTPDAHTHCFAVERQNHKIPFKYHIYNSPVTKPQKHTLKTDIVDMVS